MLNVKKCFFINKIFDVVWFSLFFGDVKINYCIKYNFYDLFCFFCCFYRYVLVSVVISVYVLICINTSVVNIKLQSDNDLLFLYKHKIDHLKYTIFIHKAPHSWLTLQFGNITNSLSLGFSFFISLFSKYRVTELCLRFMFIHPRIYVKNRDYP